MNFLWTQCSTITTSVVRYIHESSSDMNTIRITNLFLIELKHSPWEKTHACYCRSGLELMVGWSLGPKGKLSTIILLKGHSIKLPCRFISLYLKISASLRLHQRIFFVQNMTVNAKTHNWSKCNSKHQPPMGHLYHTH